MINNQALAFGIAVEQPPASLPADAQDYLSRVLIQISGQFNNMEREISDLKKRIEVLEGP